MQRFSMQNLKPHLELLAGIAPVICLIDCVVIPAILAFLPLIGIHSVIHGISDQVMALVVIVISGPAIIPGYLRHRRRSVLALTTIGLMCVFCANFAGTSVDQIVHIALSIGGSICLVRANLLN